LSTATLNIGVSPRRMLNPREAADYCGLSLKRFPAECTVTPIEMPTGAKLYDIHDLDAWIDALKGGRAPGADDEILGRLR
jgi:hypothetical protein